MNFQPLQQQCISKNENTTPTTN